MNTLSTLLDGLERPMTCFGDTRMAVSEVVCDSQRVSRGSVFVAIPGVSVDGHEFLPKAVEAGAAAVVVQSGMADRFLPWLVSSGVTAVVVPSSRRALASLMAAWHGHPEQRLTCVGVTGTNGKTTTTYLLQAFLSAAGFPTGLIGTIGYQLGTSQRASTQTTPGPMELYGYLADMVTAGMSHVSMEVSSHALAQDRVNRVRFAAAVFTNLTQDHLDYHPNLDQYFETKAKLFELLSDEGVSVVNLDDAYGQRLACRVDGRVITYGLRHGADCVASDLVYRMDGTEALVYTPWGERRVRMPLVGEHNVSNLLAAMTVALHCGVSMEVICESLRVFRGVPGRLERVASGAPFGVFVDYAHTPDALQHALRTLRSLPHRRLIVVFGCGGNRDRTKRPQMGAVAAALADAIVVTSDNPRHESPHAILDDVSNGIPKDHPQWSCEVDRSAAIRQALAWAQPGDLVLIAGKGHEQYQLIGDEAVPFNDRQIVEGALT